MRRVLIWALDGGLATGITGPVDVFTVVNAMAARRHGAHSLPALECQIQSVSARPIRTAGGVTIQPHARLDPEAAADVIFLPGLFIESVGPALWSELQRQRWLLPALRKQLERGTVLAANCTATLLLAEAGVLDGRVATTSWWLSEVFRHRYPKVDLRADQAVTQDRGVLCSGASTSGLQLALRLAEKFCGRGLALSAAKTLLLDGSHGSQAPYRSLAVADKERHDDALVQRAQRWIERRIGEPFQLGALAKALAVSERTVIRRFKAALAVTPGHLAQLMKIQVAKGLLETSEISWDAVCERVGYGDASSFRRLFKREVGLSPGAYQDRFARTSART